MKKTIFYYLYMKTINNKLNDIFGFDVINDYFDFDEPITIISMDEFLTKKIE
jgi:hypothetical protein